MQHRYPKSRRRLPFATSLLAGLLLLASTAALRADPSEPLVADSALLRVAERVSVPARAAGVLATLRVKEGDTVAVGDLLAEIDDVEVKLLHQRAVIEHELSQHRSANDVAIRSAEKAVAFANKEMLRFERAATGLPGSVSASEVEQSRVAFEQAELDLEQARRQQKEETLTERLKEADRAIARHKLELRRIAAPLSGVVVEILKRPGEWVEPGEDVIRVTRTDRLRAEGFIAMRHGLQELRGAPATVTVEVPGDGVQKAGGEVVFVNPEINPVSGKVQVRVEFANPGGRLRPGMRASMVIRPRRVD